MFVCFFLPCQTIKPSYAQNRDVVQKNQTHFFMFLSYLAAVSLCHHQHCSSLLCYFISASGADILPTEGHNLKPRLDPKSRCNYREVGSFPARRGLCCTLTSLLFHLNLGRRSLVAQVVTMVTVLSITRPPPTCRANVFTG